MPRTNVIDEEEVDLTEENSVAKEATKSKAKAGSEKAKAELMAEHDEIFEIILARDPRAATYYLLSKKAAEDAVKQFLMMMSQMQSGKNDEDEIDKAIKAYILKKMQEEEEEKKELKKGIMPFLMSRAIDAITSIKVNEMYNDCVRNAMINLMFQGKIPTPQEIANIMQACRQQAEQAKAMISNLVGQITQNNFDITKLIGGSTNAGTAAVSQALSLDASQESNEEVDEDEYDGI